MRPRSFRGISSSSTTRIVMLSTVMGPLGSLFCGSRHGNGNRLLIFLEVHVRQEDLETCDIAACAREGPEADCPAIFLDNAFADPETQTRTFGGFSGEERFEEVLCMFWIDAGAGIADGDTNGGTVAPPHGFEDMQSQCAAT